VEQTTAVHPPAVAWQIRQTLEDSADGSLDLDHRVRLEPDDVLNHRCLHLHASVPITVRVGTSQVHPLDKPDAAFNLLVGGRGASVIDPRRETIQA